MKVAKRLFFQAMLAVLLAAPLLHASPQEEVETLIHAGKPDAAIEVARKEASENEQDPFRRYNLGLVLYRTEHYDEAIRVFQSIDLTADKELQGKSALQLGNVQFRLAQKLAKMKNPPGAILSMERALGYYEAANEIGAGKESKSNLKTATAQLGKTLLELATKADTNATGYSTSGNLHFEEVSLREALQARQRAGELDPANSAISPLIAEDTKRLVANLARQGAQLGNEADEAKVDATIKGKRVTAIARYDDALRLDAQNAPVAAAREEQAKKLSNFLTDQAEKQASPILEKPPAELDKKDQANLQQARAKLDDALSLDSANARAAALRVRILKQLEESYVAQGDQAMAAAEAAPAAKDKLDFVKIAIDRYQQALELNPSNQHAQEGLRKAQAMLADLYAAAGLEDLAKAKGMLPADVSSLKSLSTPNLQTVITALESSVLNLATAVGMKPENTSSPKSLKEARRLLDAANAENDKRNLAANAAAAAAAVPAPGNAAGDNPSAAGAGGMLPLSLNNFGARKPVTESKFWNNKTRDW